MYTKRKPENKLCFLVPIDLLCGCAQITKFYLSSVIFLIHCSIEISKHEISSSKTFYWSLYMETKEIIQIISNFGFPVLMCLLLFYYIRNEQKKTNEILQELKMAIYRNSLIIEQFIKYKEGERNE